MTGRARWGGLLIFAGLALACGSCAAGEEPPAVNPFGSPADRREDAVPGYVGLSDGSVRLGQVYLTRDARLKIFDDKQQRFRQVPLRAVRRIDAVVVKEWLEKEWRFKENANDAKVYTGRSYPAREYVHTLTLTNGQTIRGPLAAIVYVRAEGSAEAERFLLHKRDKGEAGAELRSLLYVRTVRLGEGALEEGRRKAAGPRPRGR